VRIAILGGTFDPVHNGHLAAAQSVASTFFSEEVHFVPAYQAPHKQAEDATSAFHRFAMVALAIAPFERFRASSIEMETLEKCYTVETLDQMHFANPGAQLVFVMGTDMYQEIETWKDPRRLFSLAHLAVINRPGFPFRGDLAPHRVVRENERIELPPLPAVFYLPFVEKRISSTALRQACRNGQDVRESLPEAVWTYVQRHKLYS
jgi:nicotinate-nucleotide adenylyltransferase